MILFTLFACLVKISLQFRRLFTLSPIRAFIQVLSLQLHYLLLDWQDNCLIRVSWKKEKSRVSNL